MRRRSHVVRVCLVGLLVVGVAACGGGDSSSSSSGSSSASSSSESAAAAPTAPPAPTPAPLIAPVIVQVENSPDARPQSGLGEADVVYEYETEGGITRFSTIWFHFPPGQVGPIRSARLATVKISKIWDGSLVYSGSVPYIAQQLAAAGVRSVAETGGPSFRISSRFAPHNLYSDGSHLAGYANKVHAAPVSYQLWPRTSALPVGGTPALHASVGISSYEKPGFTYTTGGYTRTEPTGVLNDANTGKPWTVPTIVILQVPVTVGPEVEDGCCTHGVDIGVQGTGPAQVLTGGWSFTGTFNQGASGPPQLTMANGQPMPIAPGQVLVILMKTGNKVTTTA